MNSIIKYIERAYPYLLLAPVVLPVVIWGGLIYPYLVPKTLLFYAISIVAVVAFSILFAYGRSFYFNRLSLPETWIPGALLALAYVASFCGVDFYRSFWSLFVRGDGLLMLTCAIASFYLILFNADRAFFERLLRAVAIVASFVALYGIGEWFIGGGRIGSLLGNAAFFAGYLGIAFFATLAAARTLEGGGRRAAYAGAALQIVAIILTATRGTVLALGVALLATLVYRAIRGEGRCRVRARIVLGGLLLLGGLFFGFRAQLTHIPFEPIARIASVSTTETDVASRLFIWKNMLKEVGKSPWLGVGAEHIDALFNRFYDPTKIVEQWFDRTHNAFLDYLVQYGIGGFLLYLALIGTFFTTTLRYARRHDRATAGFFALLAVTYAVQNFFVFDTVSSFWLVLALLAGFMALSFESDERTALRLPAWTRYAVWPFAVIALLLIIPVSVQPALAAYNLSQAYTYQLTDVTKEVSALSHGVALGTYGNVEYGYEAYEMYAMHQAGFLTGQAREDAYTAALTILTTNFNNYSYDARTAIYLAHVLSLAPPEVTIDQNLLSAALARATSESPKRSQPWYILANLSISKANEYPPQSSERIALYADARGILTRYIAVVPTLSAPHFVLAQLLYASGDKAGATTEAQLGKEYYQEDLETARRAVGYYETVLDLPNAAFFLQEVLRLDPGNAAAASDLAKIQAYEQSKK